MDVIEGEPPEFYEALGRTIQVLRTDQSLDRKDLADRCGISYSYLAAIENGKKPPSSKVLFGIAEALGLHSHELLASVETRFQRHMAHSRLTPRFATPSQRRAWFHEGREGSSMVFAAARPSPLRQDPAADEAAAQPLPPSAAPVGSVPYSPTGFLLEMDRLNAELSDEDRDLVLGLARRLAARE